MKPVFVCEPLEQRQFLSTSLETASFASIANDAQGTLHVAYVDTGDSSLKYVTRSPTGDWSSSLVIDGSPMAGAQVSLALLPNGSPAVAYYEPANKDLKFARLNGGTWSSSIVDAKGDVGQNPSLAVNGKGLAAISYYNADKKDLRLATQKGLKWKLATVDAKGDVGRYSSLAINPADGTVNVAYEATDKRQIRAKLGKKKFNVATLLSATDWASKPSLAFAANGTPSVAFADPATSELTLSQLTKTRKKQSWSNVVAATGVGLGTDVQVFFDTQASQFTIAYRTSNGNVRMATTEESVWTTTLLGTSSFLASAISPGSNSLAVLTSGTVQDVSATLEAPRSLTAQAVSISQVNLFWIDIAAGDTGYRIDRAVAGSTTFTTIGTADDDASGYADMTVEEGKTYTYRVYAVMGQVTSIASASAAITIPTDTPTNLTATATAPTVTLAWQDHSSTETGFIVQRSLNGAAWTTIATRAANTTGYVDANVTVGEGYYYRVIAQRAGGNSPPSDVAQVAASGAPAAPTAFAVKAVSDTEVVMTWERVGNRETGLTVWRSTAGGEYKPLAVLPGGSNIYTDTSGYAGTAYSYRLTADNKDGNSLPTVAQAVTTQASWATLPTAIGFQATATSATDVLLSWTDSGVGPGSRNWMVERSLDGLSFSILAMLGNGTEMSYTDSVLTPGTTYYYRVRVASFGGYSDYTPFVAVNTPARNNGLPSEPTALGVVVHSGTSATVSWASSNGGSTHYVVEMAAAYWQEYQSQWTEVGTTVAGATSFTLSTNPETAYYVRVKAVNAAGASSVTKRVIFRTASAGTGSPKAYHIGPGQTYTSLAALDWRQLGPGDTVYIHPNKNPNGAVIPYFERPMISVRGTQAAPITVIGVPDEITGALPIIDGSSAVLAPQWINHYAPMNDYGLFLIGTRTDNNRAGWSPGYLDIADLEVQNGHFGFFVEKGDHITIERCDIHDNDGGIFAAGQGFERNLENLTIARNQIHHNGVVGSFYEHNTYIEGIDTIYEYNTYGSIRSGAGGGGLKDRGAGTVVRYNSFNGGARLVDIVEGQNYLTTTITLPSYNRTLIYGNVFHNDLQTGSTMPLHYGGDQGAYAFNRKGTLFFYNNTFVNRMDQTGESGNGTWRLTLFDLTTGADTLDARNNIIAFRPITPGMNHPDLDLLTPVGVAYLGRNWISPSWSPSRNWGAGFVGLLSGTDNLVTNAQNEPGFANLATRDYRLAAGAQGIDLGEQIPDGLGSVNFELFDKASNPRAIVGPSADLGAYESKI